MSTTAVRARATGVRARDVAVVAVLITIGVLGTAHVDADASERSVDALAYVAAVVGLGALVFWRRWSIVVAGVVAVTMTTYLGRNYPGGPALMAGPLALLALGYTASRRTAWIGAAAVAVMATAGHVIARGGFGAYDLVVVGWALAAVLAGQALAARGERAAAAREQLAHQQQQALANERLRLAQDLHDSVAHAMATINVQSGVAAHLLAREGTSTSQPQQVRDSLEAIRAASAAALDELGSILGVLRQPGEAPRSPTADLSQLADLVERAEADGVRVTSRVTGAVESVPPTVSTAAYRVVQEALTNTRRHAGRGVTADLSIDVGADGALCVALRDDGGTAASKPPADEGAGLGLIGMRERVEATGGRLDAGPDHPRGFHVVATWAADRDGSRP